VVLTSNNSRDLSEALRRRCLYLHIGYPSPEREREILLAKVPDLPEFMAAQVAQLVRSIRRLPLRKPPSVSETIDWARALLALEVRDVDVGVARDTLHVLLKSQADLERAAADLG
jgi:MoxR-like ATPase